MLKLKLLATTAFVLSVSLGIASAQEPAKPSDKPDTGMMEGQPGMMGKSGGGMMGMMNGADPMQMKRMVENCNRMMESMMQTMPAAPAPEKKG